MDELATISIDIDGKKKIEHSTNEVLSMKQQIDDLNEAIKDLAKTLGEEYNVKPAIFQKAWRVAYKATLEKDKATQTNVEVILDAAGRT